MAEKRRRGRLSSSANKNQSLVVSLVADHRANDIVAGHVGRLTYFPAVDAEDEETVGRLDTNRFIEPPESLFLASPFETWYPASRLPFQADGDAPRVRDHLAWLLKQVPDALAGTVGPWSGLTKHIRGAASVRPPEARLPLLALGEVSCFQYKQPTSCAAVAMATGNSGQILRVACVRDREFEWKPAVDASISFAYTPASEEEGHWCGNGAPIRQIQFAVFWPIGSDASNIKETVSSYVRAKMARCVLVQTSVATTLLEPILQNLPAQCDSYLEAGLADCGFTSHGPSTIRVQPVLRIGLNETSGEVHCDMAFHPATAKSPPQLAVISEGGSWFVWNLNISHQTVKDKQFLHTLTARGRFMDDLRPMPPMTRSVERGYLHRVTWLPKGDPDIVLLSNAACLKVMNTKTGVLLQTFAVTRPNATDAILDIQPCPTRPSSVFVLTSMTLFWLELDHSPPAVRSKKPKGLASQPCVLLSCPHLRDVSDETLKLHVTSTKTGACLALVYSTIEADVHAFWFVAPDFGGQASFRQQILRLPGPVSAEQLKKKKGEAEDAEVENAETDKSEAEEGDQRHLRDQRDKRKERGGERDRRDGQQTLLVLPRDIVLDSAAHLSGRGRGEFSFGRHYLETGAQFLQFVSLGHGLDLRSATYLCVPQTEATTPVRAPTVTQRENRKRAKAVLTSGFVVPDGVDDAILDAVEGVQKLKAKWILRWNGYRETGSGGKRGGRQTIDLSPVYRLLDHQVTETARSARQHWKARREDDEFLRVTAADLIVDILEAAGENGSHAVTTLLSAATDAGSLDSFGADYTIFSWASALADLQLQEKGHVHIYDWTSSAVARGDDSHAKTLYAAMVDLCMPRKSVSARRRRGLFEYAAPRLFLSLISMRVDAPKVLSASERTSREHSRATTPAASAEDVSMSSSPPAVPYWLMSSQDVDVGQKEGQAQEDTRDENSVLAAVTEDAAVARLRQYVVSVRSQPPWQDGKELRLLSHWQLGSDPAQFWWQPSGASGSSGVGGGFTAHTGGGGGGSGVTELTAEAEEREQRRRRQEKRAQRERERLQRLMRMDVSGRSEEGEEERPSTPSRPRIQHSQQPWEASSPVSSQIFPSQVFSSQVFSSQVMPSSQPQKMKVGVRGKRSKKAKGFK